MEHWNATINANSLSDRIYLRPTCNGENCTMYFGSYSYKDTSDWWLTDYELNQIQLAGTLFIGDYDHSQIVDYIFFENIFYRSADVRIEILAHSLPVHCCLFLFPFFIKIYGREEI